MNQDLNRKIVTATKWSSGSEIVAKLIVPITNMILARLLSPEAFGVVATMTMVVSFADMFADAGFQKYLVQHDFKTKTDKYQSATVAFWTNLLISLLLWGLIVLFNNQIANLVGSPGLGLVFIVAGISLPLTSFSSLQMALFRRDFEYKTLFYVRMIGIIIPFIIVIPLALLGFSYWSLIIGTISGHLANAVILTLKSKWKPQFFYRFDLLKTMFAFSLWSLLESISIWLTSWVGTFIIGSILNSYYVGLYKTSISTVNSIMAIITASTTSVLFSALSRYQNDDQAFKKTLFTFQRFVSIFVFPMSVGIFVYRDLITLILLGKQWKEASLLIGLWGLTSSVSIIFANFSSEAYRAKGKPKLSFLAQILHLVVLIPVLIISSDDFVVLSYVRSLIRFQFILVHLIIVHYFLKISFSYLLRNIFPIILSSIIMGCLAFLLQKVSNNMIWDFFSILLCIIFYFVLLLVFPKTRQDIANLISLLKLNFHGNIVKNFLNK